MIVHIQRVLALELDAGGLVSIALPFDHPRVLDPSYRPHGPRETWHDRIRGCWPAPKAARPNMLPPARKAPSSRTLCSQARRVQQQKTHEERLVDERKQEHASRS